MSIFSNEPSIRFLNGEDLAAAERLYTLVVGAGAGPTDPARRLLMTLLKAHRVAPEQIHGIIAAAN